MKKIPVTNRRHKEDLGMSDHDVVENGWDSSQHASW